MKKFRSVIVLFIIFSLVFTFASCGTEKTQTKENPMASSGGVDLTEKIPNTGFYIFFNVSKDDTKAMQDLQKKLVDAGVAPMWTQGMDEDVKQITEQIKKIMDKYNDITESQYGVIAVDLKKVEGLKDKDPEEVVLGPDNGIYLAIAVKFSKEVKVKDYLSDVQGILDEMKKSEDMQNAEITVDPEKGTMTIKPEDGPQIILYFEQDGKNIIVTIGQPFSKMEKVSENITKNAFWKEATSHTFALYLDPQQIPDEKAKNDLVKAGWKEPIRVFGDISSSEKNGVYTSQFILKGYNPSDVKFENLGIDGDIKVVKDSDLILAVDTDWFVEAMNQAAKADEQLGEYKQMIDMFAGGVITLSVSVKSMQQMAGAVVGQYFKDADKIWSMYGQMIDQYIEGAKGSMPNLYANAQKTGDGFEIVAGTFQPQLTTEKVEGKPVLYLKLNIDPAKYGEIFGMMDPEAAKMFDGYAKVIDNAEFTISVTYDEDKNMSGLKIVSIVKTK
ncbi:hypothetical protein GM182_00645 [bacterium 3DAC]|nr:hypothetical protein GM182_00645 [bacterium 3DAC]